MYLNTCISILYYVFGKSWKRFSLFALFQGFYVIQYNTTVKTVSQFGMNVLSENITSTIVIVIEKNLF